MMPGWPYSVVVALETGRTSWSALLDVVRSPRCRLAAATAVQGPRSGRTAHRRGPVEVSDEVGARWRAGV